MSDHGSQRTHWEGIYEKRAPTELSWYQERPGPSWQLFQYAQVPRDARILDVGGGDSRLVDFLLDQGFTHLTVLDISETAIARAKDRLGARGHGVRWIVSDLRDLAPETVACDVWHDRAVLHFFTDRADVEAYAATAERALSPNGKMIVGTFTENGPEKCSGLTVQRYSEESLSECLSSRFERMKCIRDDHHTPSGTVQPFVFCVFRRRADLAAA